MEYSQIEIENFKLKLMQGHSLDDLANLVNYVIEVQNQKKERIINLFPLIGLNTITLTSTRSISTLKYPKN